MSHTLHRSLLSSSGWPRHRGFLLSLSSCSKSNHQNHYVLYRRLCRGQMLMCCCCWT
nr:MAG TPA: hypothetical protein [Caudoviricetes sp.]